MAQTDRALRQGSRPRDEVSSKSDREKGNLRVHIELSRNVIYSVWWPGSRDVCYYGGRELIQQFDPNSFKNIY